MSTAEISVTGGGSWPDQILRLLSRPHRASRRMLINLGAHVMGPDAKCAALLWLWDTDWKVLALNVYATNLSEANEELASEPEELVGLMVSCAETGGAPDPTNISLEKQEGLRAWAQRGGFSAREHIVPVHAPAEGDALRTTGLLQFLSDTPFPDATSSAMRDLAGGIGALLARSRDDRRLLALENILNSGSSTIEEWLRVAAETLRDVASAEACVVFRRSQTGNLHAVVLDPPVASIENLKTSSTSVIRLVADSLKAARVWNFSKREARLQAFATDRYDENLLNVFTRSVLPTPLRSLLVAPVVFEQHGIAVIALLNKRASAHLAQVFSQTDEAVLKTVCLLLAGLLPSLDLYDSVGRMAEIVYPGALDEPSERAAMYQLLVDMLPGTVSAVLVRRKQGEAQSELFGGEEWLEKIAASLPKTQRVKPVPAPLAAQLDTDTDARYYYKHDVPELEQNCSVALGLSRNYLTQYEFRLLSFFLKELSHVLRAEQELDRVLDHFVQLRHAIRTGLTGVVGYVHESLGIYDAYERDGRPVTILAQARFGKSLRRANFAAAKTRILLEESRYLLGQISRETLRLGASSIGSLVREVIDSLRPIAAAREIEIRFQNEMPSSLDRVTMDRLLIEMLIFNVIDNAIKYSYRRKTVEVHLFVSKGFWCLDVTDEGILIRPDDRDSIFRKFVRKPTGQQPYARPGTGLGLTVSKSIAEVHDGTIDFASAPHYDDVARTTFTIRIPRELH